MTEPQSGWTLPAGSSGGDVDIAVVGALVSDPARCRILLALGAGRALPASRLAADAGISAGTASSHLAKLTEAGLLTVEAHGRFRYYRLSGPDVSDLIEVLERFAPTLPVRSLRQSRQAYALREARLCYDHLAGRLSVELMRMMIKRGYLTLRECATADRDAPRYALDPSGTAFFDEFGVRIGVRRILVRHHLDSSEQEPHLSGALGRGLLDRFVELDWIRRSEDSRAAVITPAGRRGLDEILGIQLDR
jgi:DNA-binding transcriptional ArsR family regulator